MLTKGKIDEELIHSFSENMMFQSFQVFTRKRQKSKLCRRRNIATSPGGQKRAIHLQFPGSFARNLCSWNDQDYDSTLDPRRELLNTSDAVIQIRIGRITDNAKYAGNFHTAKEEFLFFARIVRARLVFLRLPYNLRWTHIRFTLRYVQLLDTRSTHGTVWPIYRKRDTCEVTRYGATFCIRCRGYGHCASYAGGVWSDQHGNRVNDTLRIAVFGSSAIPPKAMTLY